jgi:methyl coenzyme M reductase subunit C-like uncharacterized protein (methanogenesis marker protein 7)
VELSLDVGYVTDMEIGAPRRRAEEIWVKGYLKVIDRDRHRWLDGMRDIHEHDLRIWELGQNSQCITTRTFSRLLLSKVSN